MKKFNAGTCVCVPAAAGWQKAFTGTITDRPPRPMATTAGQDLACWVEFDEGRYDADGDGPYGEGKILSTYLEVLHAI